MTPLVVVPTFNEVENIGRLVPRILGSLPGAHVLVIDDSSPDGTGRRVRSLARRYRGRIRLLARPRKMGLGGAYMAGFREALSAPRYGPVFQMDADGSHDPGDLPRFAASLRRHDAVVGSRYQGGMRVLNWPWHRLFLSTMANRYASLVTGTSLTDLTGGFNGWNRDALAALVKADPRCSGYAFQIEIKHICARLGFDLAELPILFSGRVEGKSKLSRAVILEAVWAVWRMRFQHSW
jgi:dolichol-phosphate mannosyltransferase